MNFRTAKAWQPELTDKRPRTIATRNSQELFAALGRAHQLKLINGKWEITERREYSVQMMNRGRRNAEWELEVYYDD